MQYTDVERRDRIAIVRFDRGIAANPLSLDLMIELTAVARSFENDSTTSAVILTGRDDNFSLGADLKDRKMRELHTADLAARRIGLMTGARMCRAWEEIQPLTLCAIEGWCIGGGVALSVSTDLRVASSASRFYVPEIERGMNMSWGSVPRIANLVGPARAKRLIILAEQISAETACNWGLIDEQTETGSALETALQLASRAASMPPVALRMCKQDINAYCNALNQVASHSDYDQFALAQDSADYREGVDAFLEKRTPHYTGA